MSIPRKCLAHVVLLERLYVFGGMDGQGRKLNSVEYYDPLIDQWETVAPMRYNKFGPAACTWNGFVYVVGGCDSAGYFVRLIERYDPRENAWTGVS